MNHKRKKPKNARSGCLCCKPHKMNGKSKIKAMKHSDRKKTAE